MATYDELKVQAQAIKNEILPSANTANRVGGLMEEMIGKTEEEIAQIERNYVKLEGVNAGAVTPRLTSFLRQSLNIFNKNSLEHGFNVDNSGAIVENQFTALSGFYEVKPLDIIQYPSDISVVEVFYNANKEFIQRRTSLVGSTSNTVPGTGYYVRFVIAIENLTKDIMISIGETRYPYEPFGVTFNSGIFTNNPDKIAEEIIDSRGEYDSLKQRIDYIAKGIRIMKPCVATAITTPSDGKVVESFYDNRIFGRNKSGSQIWYCDDGNYSERKDFIVDATMAFSEIVPVSMTRILANNRNDSSLYLIENSNGIITKTKVLEWIVSTTNATFGADVYPRVGRATIVLMAEYGTKDPVNYPRHVHLSVDGGETWRIIFELPNEVAGMTHTHGVHYDPFADRVWICNGDIPATNLWYSDDWREDTPTWIRVFTSLEAPTQFTSIYSTPQKVLFGTDGPVNGIWAVEKDVLNQKKPVAAGDVKPHFIFDPTISTNYVGRQFKEFPGQKGIFVPFSDTGTTRGETILASQDGDKWFQIISKPASANRLTAVSLYKNKIMYSYAGLLYENIVEWYNE